MAVCGMTALCMRAERALRQSAVVGPRSLRPRVLNVTAAHDALGCVNAARCGGVRGVPSARGPSAFCVTVCGTGTERGLVCTSCIYKGNKCSVIGAVMNSNSNLRAEHPAVEFTHRQDTKRGSVLVCSGSGLLW